MPGIERLMEIKLEAEKEIKATEKLKATVEGTIQKINDNIDTNIKRLNQIVEEFSKVDVQGDIAGAPNVNTERTKLLDEQKELAVIFKNDQYRLVSATELLAKYSSLISINKETLRKAQEKISRHNNKFTKPETEHLKFMGKKEVILPKEQERAEDCTKQILPTERSQQPSHNKGPA